MFAHWWLGYQGVACHELYLEKFGVQHPVFSTTLASDGYKGSNLSLSFELDRSLTDRVYAYGGYGITKHPQKRTLPYELAAQLADTRLKSQAIALRLLRATVLRSTVYHITVITCII